MANIDYGALTLASGQISNALWINGHGGITTTSGTTVINDVLIVGSGTANNSTAGSITYNGVKIQPPALNQGSGGTVTENIFHADFSSSNLTTGGTATAFQVTPYDNAPWGAGTLVGFSANAIGTLTAGATMTAFQVGIGWDMDFAGSQWTSGTMSAIRVPTGISNTVPTKPACAATTDEGQIVYLNDANDSAAAQLCMCGRWAASDVTYSWQNILLATANACTL